MSTIRHEEVGASNQPSPSIWNRFSLTRMQQLGYGYFFHEDFFGAPQIAATLATGHNPVIGPFAFDGDAATVFARQTDLGGVLDVETDGDDNDAYALYSLPFCTTVLNSGQPWAFECLVELGDVAMDGGMFVGLAESAGLSRDVIADNAGALIGESLVGFQVLTDNPDAVDAVYKLDAGTAVEMVADATNSSAITAQGGTVASLVNDTPVKLGMSFDGRESLSIFVNGYKIFTQTIDSTFPTGVQMGLVALALKTGAGAAESAAIDWARGAYEVRR